jgi:hypothetical protein
MVSILALSVLDPWSNQRLTDRHKKSHAPLPPSLIKLLVSNKENKWMGRHVTPLGLLPLFDDIDCIN